MVQAEEHFARLGVGASLEAIARDAGVGSATLYRHFPTREDLLAGIFERHIVELDAEIDRIQHLQDSGEALAAWLAVVEEFFSTFEGLPEPVRAAMIEEGHPLASPCAGFLDRTAEFLEAAQRDGKVRKGLRAQDLFLAALALSWVRGSSFNDEQTPANLRDVLRNGYGT
ncbi:TetR/AcrR family transcriptional regulator [Nocardiopsis sp. ARC36]